MSLDADGLKHQEIIIVRRGGHDEDEAHHGGVWKIAFADFMTAMMCFFLVMWLINAANEQTRAALASYFNPVKLVDRNTSRKGLDDPAKTPGDPELTAEKTTRETAKPSLARDTPKGSSQEENSLEESNTRKHSDKNLFADPYSVLAEIAGETGTLQNTSMKGDGGAQVSGPATGASGGQTYRDPFAPNFWSEQVDIPEKSAETARSGSADKRTRSGGTAEGEKTGQEAAGKTTAAAEAMARMKAEAKAGREEAVKPEKIEAAARQVAASQESDRKGPALSSPATASGSAEAGMKVAEAKPAAGEAEKPGKAAGATARAANEKLTADIRGELAASFKSGDPIYKGLTVTETDRGVLISVSDQSNFGMFEIGSAVPNRDTVLAMEKISKILSTHKGNIRIDGHTDGRPFKSDTYDNWRLSTARAQTAYYMLVRAGLDEKRVMEVAGFADRKLKVKDDPYADANRRIEILLETR
jgi:chemotaxis protein MotB